MHNFSKFIETSLLEVSSVFEIKKHWEIDHVCFRTHTLEEYEEYKLIFSHSFNLLTETIIGQRPISTYKLTKPMRVSDQFVDLIELPAPKSGKPYTKGYEHLEIVIDISFEELMAKYPSVTWKTSGVNKSLNPELQACFEGFNIKFHHHNLEHIIHIEEHKLAHTFLSESEILTKLKHFNPLISGTIPLGIANPQSDLDILFECQDFSYFSEEVKNLFPGAIVKTDQDFTIAKLCYSGLKIELFCQKISPLNQNAHRHLRIEGRLLKLLGESFRKKIIQLKMDGVKTEPAFGELLSLKDPYQDLLHLYERSDSELYDQFLEFIE